jgi:C4-type Zn-finger protein
MKVIEQATRKLVQKVNSTCPQCQTPGFGIVDAKMGLKCGLCQTPTNSVLSYLYVCDRCQFVKEEMYPNQKTSEDPMYCNVCNP